MDRIEIRVKGQIDEARSGWFDGMDIVPDGPDGARISGAVADQAALFGLLTRVRDLGLSLISVQVFSAELEGGGVDV